MQVVNNTQNNYPEDPIRFFNFEQFEDIANDCKLFIGGWPDSTISEPADVPKYFFSTEEQAWDRDDTDQFVPYVDKIFTICPPHITNREKREAAFFPISEDLVPTNFDKQYDVIYTGYAGGHHVSNLLDVIRHFNYRLVSFDSNGGLTTNQNATYKEKLDLIAASKSCIVHNLTSSNSPQLKSRGFEAAFCKSLMLVQRDEWNIIEDWFEPGQDFLYYNDPTELKMLIQVTDQYNYIVEHAYEKAMTEYTTKRFIEKYIGFK